MPHGWGTSTSTPIRATCSVSTCPPSIPLSTLGWFFEQRPPLPPATTPHKARTPRKSPVGSNRVDAYHSGRSVGTSLLTTGGTSDK